MLIRDFRDLTLWRRAVAFAVPLYRVTHHFTPSERYGVPAPYSPFPIPYTPP